MAPGGDLLLVQSFSQGSLFPTQGDAGVLPYTVILWDAADRGFFFTDAASGVAGVIATASVLPMLGAEGEPPCAVLVMPSAEESDGVWALRLGYGELGSDPGAVTYQGEPLPGEEAAAWLGMTPPELPASPLDLTAGYLIIAGLSGFDADGGEGFRLNSR